MGYARGVRRGHAGGHLRGPACELVEAIWTGESRWWEGDNGDGIPFGSPQEAYEHLGRLWHCTDQFPSYFRELAQEFLGRDGIWSYAILVRALRPYIAERLMADDRQPS